MEPIKVLLVDDHAMFRKGLRALMAQRKEVAVVGEAGDGYEALEKAMATRPDVILMDIRMPGCDGVTGVRLIRESLPEAKVIMLTMSDDDSDLFEAIRAGAQGYLLKSLKPEDLFEFLQSAIREEAPLSAPIAARLLDEFRHMAERTRTDAIAPVALTPREKEILQFVAEGYSNKAIGAHLYIASGTVKNHLHNILEKLQFQNRAQVAAYATEVGLVGPRRTLPMP